MSSVTAPRALLVVLIALAALAALRVSAAGGEQIPYSSQSISRGKVLYLQNCQDCHGENGKAEGSAIAVAADLTRPDSWKHGQTDREMFSSIRNGAGDNMPPFGPIGPGLKDDQIWDLVNFILSIGPDSKRPTPVK